MLAMAAASRQARSILSVTHRGKLHLVVHTAWSLTYLFLNFRKSLTGPRHFVSLALTGATLASSALYGSEYFLLQGDE